MNDTVKIKNKGNVKIIAHRGLSGIERENTCSAFVAAGNRSYFGIETDVRKTLDGHFVLCHDGDTERNCVDKLIPEQSTFRTLRRLQYKDRDGSFDRGDLIMPTLQEYLKICKGYGKKCVLEFKGRYSEEALSGILAIVDSFGMEENMIYISFLLDNLLTLRRLRQTAQAQWLVSEITKETLDTLLLHRLGLDAYYPVLTEETVTLLHKNGLAVNCWTVDDPVKAEKLIAMGVDMITSNILE